MASHRLLDLFSGACGAAMGYARAGFDVVGVDNRPQKNYPFAFIQADALEYVAEHGHEYDAIHASPPCQGYSIMNNLPWLKGREYPLLILPTLDALERLGKPYVIENVMGARYGQRGLAKRGLEDHGLQAGWLCGWMFGLPFQRHRLFASNIFWLAPGHPKHKKSPILMPTLSGNFNPFHKDGKSIVGAGNKGKGSGLILRPGYEHVEFSMPTLANWQNGAQFNGVGVGIGHAKGWHLAAEAMGIDWMTRAELTQAIPPIYCEFIGAQLLKVLHG